MHIKGKCNLSFFLGGGGVAGPGGELFSIPKQLQWNLDYPDSLGLGKIVWIIEGPDNQKYKY